MLEMNGLDVVAGDYSEHRMEHDDEASPNEYYGWSIRLNEEVVIALSEEEATFISDRLHGAVESLRKWRRERLSVLEADVQRETTTDKESPTTGTVD